MQTNNDTEWKLIKNPNTLDNFRAKCRGVILINGDLYLENFSSNTIHNDILKELYKMKVLPEIPKKNWTKKLPQESGFLTVQRYRNSEYICIGESNSLIYDYNDWKKLIHFYDEIISKAKIKNPNINFSNLLVGIKFYNADISELKNVFNKKIQN